MSWDPAMDDLLSMTVTRRPFDGQNVYGEKSHGSPVVLAAHVTSKPRLIVTSGGGQTEGTEREVVSRAQVITHVVGWDTRDQIELPDGSTPQIIHVDTHTDEDGEHHQTVWV